MGKRSEITKIKGKNQQLEASMQKACVGWFKWQYSRDNMLLFAVPNGAMLHGNEEERIRRGKMLKEQGLLPGVADLMLSRPGKLGDHGLYIELKLPNNSQTDSQKQFEHAVKAQGYGYELCFSFEDFQTIINAHYGNDK